MFSCAPSKNRDRRGKAAQKVLQRLHETHLPDWALNESPKSTAKGWAVGSITTPGYWQMVNRQWSMASAVNGQWSMVNAYRSTVDQ